MFVRENIKEMHGYTPGEQPKDRNYVKLNTNENPYSISSEIEKDLRNYDFSTLFRYPDPVFVELRKIAAQTYGMPNADWVLAGNGSDDLLTIAVRTFVDQGGKIACPDVTYSLYSVLANIQGASTVEIPLTDNYDLPENIEKLSQDATLFFLARPNAPTGKAYSLEKIRELCRNFKGIVWIDEAYADFAQENCMELVKEFDNVVVSRTFSKSFSLAGARLGLAFANSELISEMMKVKDSYNVNALTQVLGISALRNIENMRINVEKIIATRKFVVEDLLKNGYEVVNSEANFVLVSPRNVAAKEMLQRLKEKGFLVRWFSQDRISKYLRVTIGTDEDMKNFLLALYECDK